MSVRNESSASIRIALCDSRRCNISSNWTICNTILFCQIFMRDMSGNFTTGAVIAYRPGSSEFASGFGWDTCCSFFSCLCSVFVNCVCSCPFAFDNCFVVFYYSMALYRVLILQTFQWLCSTNSNKRNFKMETTTGQTFSAGPY